MYCCTIEIRPLSAMTFRMLPGSILDSYLTLDIVSPQGTLNLLSSGHCDWIAARIGNQLVEVVLFQEMVGLMHQLII